MFPMIGLRVLAAAFLALSCAAEGAEEKRDTARTSEPTDATTLDAGVDGDAVWPPPRWGWPPDAGDSGVCKYVLLFEFDDVRGCVKGGRWSLEPCAYHAYGEDSMGGAARMAAEQ